MLSITTLILTNKEISSERLSHLPVVARDLVESSRAGIHTRVSSDYSLNFPLYSTAAPVSFVTSIQGETAQKTVDSRMMKC